MAKARLGVHSGDMRRDPSTDDGAFAPVHSRIPAVAQFLWFGRELPWIYGLALRSAALRGGFAAVVLHHADPLEGTPGWDLALGTPGVEARPLRPEALLEGVGPLGGALADLYRRLGQPAARANLLRAALLYTEGGVYLDTDTVTLGSLAPLLGAGVFCGEEHLCLPEELFRTLHPGRWARALLLLALRDGFRRLPEGYRLFPRVAPLYWRRVNNAVLGGAPGHPFLAALLRGMVELPARRQLRRYVLGTHLLGQTVARWQGGAGEARGAEDRGALVVHPPPLFYPLGPEISEHWFRRRRRVDLRSALAPETLVVHWYASVRTRAIVPQVTPAYVRQHLGRQLFSALVEPLL